MKWNHWLVGIVFLFVVLLVGGFFLLKREQTDYFNSPTMDGVNCGIECLLRIFHKHQILLTSKTLRATYPNSNFNSFLEIKETAEDFGFIARGYRLSLAELKTKDGDLICHLKEGHFVVLEALTTDSVTIFSPPKRVINIPIANFLEQWDGYVLVIQKGEKLLQRSDFFPMPKFYTDVQEYDFGIIKEDKRIEYYYVFYNLGDKPLKIKKIDSSCNCTEALVDKMEIHPQESGFVKVVFDSTGRIGKEESSITLVTNDPLNPKAQFILKGEIRRALEYTPKKISVGLLQPFTSKIRSVTFIGAGEKPLEIERVISSNSNIRNIKVIDYKNDPYRRAVQFEATWNEKPGPFNESITVYFKDDIFNPVTVNIEGENVSEIQVEPSGIFLNPEPISRKFAGSVSISSITKNRGFTIEKVTSDREYLNLILEKKKNGYGYRLIYYGAIPDGSGNGIIGNIYIKTNSPFQREIEIPVFFAGKETVQKSREE